MIVMQAGARWIVTAVVMTVLCSGMFAGTAEAQARTLQWAGVYVGYPDTHAYLEIYNGPNVQCPTVVVTAPLGNPPWSGGNVFWVGIPGGCLNPHEYRSVYVNTLPPLWGLTDRNFGIRLQMPDYGTAFIALRPASSFYGAPSKMLTPDAQAGLF